MFQCPALESFILSVLRRKDSILVVNPIVLEFDNSFAHSDTSVLKTTACDAKELEGGHVVVIKKSNTNNNVLVRSIYYFYYFGIS